MKGLTKFLNDKRSIFPRFFFLSNDELISILAQAREPLIVQKYMNKCFEGIEQLIFDKSCVIKGMVSRESETVLFLSAIKAKIDDNVRNVED
jgi:dynein heavy chain, axonemal